MLSSRSKWKDLLSGQCSGCENAGLQVACTQETCHDEKRCKNRATTNKTDNFLLFKTQKKGMGLKTMVDLNEGDLVLQYIGKVIPTRTYLKRLRLKKLNDPVYFMELDKGQIIDAEGMGNLARFINHSCEGNCRSDKYTAEGRPVLCIFAATDIKAGTELTYDYAFETDEEPWKCFCGSKLCRGTITKPKNSEVSYYNCWQASVRGWPHVFQNV